MCVCAVGCGSGEEGTEGENKMGGKKVEQEEEGWRMNSCFGYNFQDKPKPQPETGA